jgi:vacuolar-type H+-ATPase subunit F/Vma7
MSATPCYLGDEVSAAGYRLAGIAAIVPDSGGESAALREALAIAPLVLVSAAVAADIPETILHAAQARLTPLILVVPDILTDAAVPDVAGRLRTQLGLEA